MALPPNYGGPYTITARRRYWRLQHERTQTRETGSADVFYRRRLAESGTTLPATFPSRALLLTAGVLAVEEVIGASLEELRFYGLSSRAAETLILWIERLTMTTFGSTSPRVGQAYEEDAVTLLASAARTASVTSDTYEVGDKGTLRLDLDITAVSGTAPVLHVQIETRKAASSGTWRVVDAFELASTVSAQRRAMGGCDRFVRAVCTIAGTSPSFTFSLAGEAV